MASVERLVSDLLECVFVVECYLVQILAAFERPRADGCDALADDYLCDAVAPVFPRSVSDLAFIIFCRVEASVLVPGGLAERRGARGLGF